MLLHLPSSRTGVWSEASEREVATERPVRACRSRERRADRERDEQRERFMVGAMRGGAMELEDRLATLPRFRGDHDDDGKERRTGT